MRNYKDRKDKVRPIRPDNEDCPPENDDRCDKFWDDLYTTYKFLKNKPNTSAYVIRGKMMHNANADIYNSTCALDGHTEYPYYFYDDLPPLGPQRPPISTGEGPFSSPAGDLSAVP
jgi:hypothetical protein